MSGWMLRHPEALAGWLLVALLWWRLRRVAPAPAEWTGALAIWKRVPLTEEQSGSRARERRAIPWSVRAALCALSLGCLALADPVKHTALLGRQTWTLVLDRSPSMFLPLDTSADSRTRIATAVEQASRLCERSGVPAQAREWAVYDQDGVRTSRSALPPQEWLSPDWGHAAATPWPSLDAPGTLWISDCAPEVEPLFAGLLLTGAVPIPGPVADLGEDCWRFDGERLTRAAWESERAGVQLGAGLPADIATLATLWARSRGLSIVASGRPASLKLTCVPVAGPLLEGRLVRGTWAVRATASAPPQGEDLRPWASFEASEGMRFTGVSWRPGEVLLAVADFDGASADPATVALDWIELFEEACRPDASVVALALRLRRGPARMQANALSLAPAPMEQSAAPLLAGLASALALASIFLTGIPVGRVRTARTGRGRPSHPAAMG